MEILTVGVVWIALAIIVALIREVVEMTFVVMIVCMLFVLMRGRKNDSTRHTRQNRTK
jgi:hypothetical protein